MNGDVPADRLDQVLAKASAGDGEAWSALVRLYSPRVYGLLLRQCGDRELAEEIAQATFVTLVGSISRYREQGKFEPWLFRIAVNRLRDEMRRRKRQARTTDFSSRRDEDEPAGAGGGDMADPDSVEEKPLDVMVREENHQRLRDLVASLGEADREILHLRHTAGLSFAEIAETLDEPLGTVLARGHRALNKLKKLLLASGDYPSAPQQPGDKDDKNSKKKR